MGLTLPDDLAMIGMGNLEMGPFAYSPISTCDEKHYENGIAAMRFLLANEVPEGRFA